MKQTSVSRLLPAFAALALTTLSTVHAQAGVTIAPVVVNIDPNRTLSGQTSFTNGTNKTIDFDVVVQVWTQKDGESMLAETRDVLVNPNSFQLAPGSTQVIRIGLRKKPGGSELTYRLLIAQKNQGSTVSNEQGISLQVLPTFSLPVYISSEGFKPAVAYGVARDGGDLVLTATNTGNKHQTFNNLTVSSGTLTFNVPSRAVLAGSSFSVRLPGFAGASAPLTLSYQDYTQVQRTETVPLP
ncbi:fimbrial biogenesis chaperone [Deinococcus sp.]|uniref:fimbrial biogenesis chaperone n=1 Tax=Deinococcus sp. TaxID=47478 RepID=UPI003C7C7E8E